MIADEPQASRPLRIAITMDDFYPASGGIGRSVQTQVTELIAMGHDVTLIVPDHHLEPPAGARVITLPTFYFPDTPSHMCSLKFSPRIADSLTRRHRFDVIHSQTERGCLMLASMLAKRQHIPHIHTFHANLSGAHATMPAQAGWGSLAYAFMLRPLLAVAARGESHYRSSPPTRDVIDAGPYPRLDWHSFARMASYLDAYTTPSGFMKANIDRAAGGAATGHVVPTGVGRPLIDALAGAKRTRTGGLRFISSGRLSKEKRIGTLVRAFLQADIPGSELVIVGNGPEANTVRAIAGDRPEIRLTGYVRGLDQLADELINADVLALASYRFDSQAIVLAEGVAAGLPLLYCDERLTFGPTPNNSVLTQPESDGLAAGMRRLADPIFRATLAEASRAVQDRVGPRATAEGYLRVYREAIATKGNS